MKAFVYTEKGKIEKREIADAAFEPQSEEDRRSALLEPLYVSPCSSDVHTVFAGDGPRRQDLVLGHEGLARVLRVGAEVKDFAAGDIVAVAAVMPEPGDISGHKGVPFSGTKLGRNINGMWAERFVVPEADSNLAHIPEGVTYEAALMAVDMMATGYTAVEEAGICDDQNVVVIGSGAVGLMAASGAAGRLQGTGRVIVIGSDKDPVHIELAREMGTDIYISYRDGRILFGEDRCDIDKYSERDPRANSTQSPAVEAVFKCTGGKGADRVLICGGGQEALMQASDMAVYGSGIIVNVAYFEGSGTIGLPIFSLGRGMSGKTFKFELSRGGRGWIEKMLETAKETGSIQGKLITDRMKGFDAIPEALELMRRRPAGTVKIMVEI